MQRGWGPCNQRIPESLRAFCSMVSFTAAKTRRMFDVSVACVRLGASEGGEEWQGVG